MSMELLFTNEWLRQRIAADPDADPEAGDFKEERSMTKQVRIENADNSAFKVVVEVWDKGANGQPDVKAFDRRLDYPTAMANDIYLTSTRYFVVREAEE